MRKTPTITFVLLSMVWGLHPAQGHEFWVRPGSFHPSPGQLVSVSLRVGDDLEGTEVMRRSANIVRFELVGDGATPIPGREGGTPAGLIRLAQPGLHVIGYESTHTTIEIEASRFEDYLVDKGLDEVVAARAESGDREQAGRERFARCAKALVAAEDGEGSDQYLGMPLELVAESNPYLQRPDRPLRLRLLFRGKPLTGALIKARSLDEAAQPAAGRTDGRGRVTMTLDGSGMWLVSAVHMEPATDAPDADWESYWASLTFERRQPLDG